MNYKELRKAKGWSQMMAAKELGVTVNTWINWERGGASPNEDNVARLRIVFGLDGR